MQNNYQGGGYNRSNNQYRPRYTGPNKNYYIRALEVRVIDSNGENLGVIKTQDALERAKTQGLDLVEISPNANPPVCKIVDFAKYLYEQKKKKKTEKTQAKEMKEFVFSPVIDTHDIEIRIKRSKEFLSKGHNVRITVQKSRNRQSRDQIANMMSSLLTYFEDYSTIEAEPRFEGNKSFITFKADGKAKNKQNSNKKSEEEQSKGQ